MKLSRRIDGQRKSELLASSNKNGDAKPTSFEWSPSSGLLIIRLEDREAVYSIQLSRPEVQRMHSLLSQVRL